MIGCPVERWCAVACLPGELSQQPTWPQVWHILRWTHDMPRARHSSHPSISGGSSRYLTESRWAHSTAAIGLGSGCDLGWLATREPVGLDGRRAVAQVTLGVERSHAAGASGGDRLPVGAV